MTLPGSGLLRSLRDLVADVLIELDARKVRAVLLQLGVAFSTGVIVASIGVSQLAARQIDADLAASGTAALTVGLREAIGNDVAPRAFPADTEDRVRRIDLVIEAGRRIDVAPADAGLTRFDPSDHAIADHGAHVIAATSGYLTVAGVAQPPTAFQLDAIPAPRVALVGSAAVRELGLPIEAVPGVQIWVQGRPYAVVGYVTGGERVGLSDAVILPYDAGVGLAGVVPADVTVHVLVRPGAAGPVASVVRSAIRPEAPEALTVSSVADISRLRVGVGDQLARLTAGIGALLLGLAMLLIANSMVVSVMSRSAEVGLRRALGASRLAVAGLFLIEGGLAGLLGGLAGASLGALATTIVAAINSWGTTFPWLPVAGAPVIGLVVGVLASAYPAWRASGIEPAEALRSD